jgi:hypothetical protein
MSLADFETLFDFLEHPIQILHYLLRRQEIEEEFFYIGDEVDLMGLYEKTLFDLNGLDFRGFYEFTGMSETLDSYYIAKDSCLASAGNGHLICRYKHYGSHDRRQIDGSERQEQRQRQQRHQRRQAQAVHLGAEG